MFRYKWSKLIFTHWKKHMLFLRLNPAIYIFARSYAKAVKELSKVLDWSKSLQLGLANAGKCFYYVLQLKPPCQVTQTPIASKLYSNLKFLFFSF